MPRGYFDVTLKETQTAWMFASTGWDLEDEKPRKREEAELKHGDLEMELRALSAAILIPVIPYRILDLLLQKRLEDDNSPGPSWNS